MEEKNIPEKFKDIVEKVEKMSVLDLSELVKVLEERFGVSAQQMMAMPVGGNVAVDGEAEADAGPSLKTVELKEAGDQKVQVIKILREALGLGLKEVKDLVDAAPKAVKEGMKAEEAEDLKSKLEAAGAKVEIK